MYSNTYNPGRQYHFVLRQFTLFQNRWLISAAAVFGFMLLVSVLVAHFNPKGLGGLPAFYAAVFSLGGLIFTSQIFRELQSPRMSYSLLTLPSSTLEKLLGSWLISSPIYIILFTAISYLIYAISFLIAGTSIDHSLFFTEALAQAIGSYLVIQTIFLWGACYFRKHNFIKTLLALIVFGCCMAAYIAFTAWLLLDKEVRIAPEYKGMLENALETANNIFFWGILGPYMLLTTYFTLKERQV